MRFAAFGVLEYEVEIFKNFMEKYNLEIDLYNAEIDEAKIDNYDIYDGISMITLKNIDNSAFDKFKNIKFVATRSIGYQYLDLDYLKSRGIVVTNASYDPYNVADFTIMQMLMLMRKAKVSVCRALVNDFSLDGMKGKELRNCTVGIIGTGKIGKTVIKQLSGFGCKILCYDLYQNEEVKKYATYVSLDDIYKNSDIISLHMPLTKENYHIINKETISKMKQGVLLINTARGGLISTDDLILAIEDGKIGGAALDTIEGEEGLAHFDLGTSVVGLSSKKDIMYLKQFANVLFTQHYAFFTQEAVTEMVHCSIKSMLSLINNQEYKNRII